MSFFPNDRPPRSPTKAHMTMSEQQEAHRYVQQRQKLYEEMKAKIMYKGTTKNKTIVRGRTYTDGTNAVVRIIQKPSGMNPFMNNPMMEGSSLCSNDARPLVPQRQKTNELLDQIVGENYYAGSNIIRKSDSGASRTRRNTQKRDTTAPTTVSIVSPTKSPNTYEQKQTISRYLDINDSKYFKSDQEDWNKMKCRLLRWFKRSVLPLLFCCSTMILFQHKVDPTDSTYSRVRLSTTSQINFESMQQTTVAIGSKISSEGSLHRERLMVVSETNANKVDTNLTDQKSTHLRWVPDYAKVHTFTYPEIETNDSENVTSSLNNCIVTAYFRLKSKYSANEYVDNWMPNFLSMQDDCMVIFCEKDLMNVIYDKRVEQLRKYNGNEQTMTVKTTFIIELDLNDLPISKYYYDANSKDELINLLRVPPSESLSRRTHSKQNIDGKQAASFWENQLNIDRERKIHASYQVFWIWLSKSWFVNVAGNIIINHNMDLAMDGSKMGDHTNPNEEQNLNPLLMWIDIGSFRNEKFNTQTIITHKEIVPDNSILWMSHRTPNPPPTIYWNDKLNKLEKHHFYHSGSSGVGYFDTWNIFHTKFIETLYEFTNRDQNMFIGEDQCILQTTCLLHPNLCSYVDSTHVPDNNYFGLRYVMMHGNTTTGHYKTHNGLLPSFWMPSQPQ